MAKVTQGNGPPHLSLWTSELDSDKGTNQSEHSGN